ncbi:MAG: 2-oxoglutarate dehydrogenase component, partial [Verrucomicrobiota bacterium]
MNPSSVSTSANAALIEEYHQRWLEDHNSVDPTWRAFFQGFTLGSNGQPPSSAPDGAIVDNIKQSGVYYLISAYRTIGHTQAHL